MNKPLLRFFAPILPALFMLLNNNCFGQSMRYLNIDNGLSNNSVNTLFQDSYGFFWFGTYDGLNRYDGSNFQVFKNKWNDEESLSNNHVNCITEGWEKKIWIGTENGVVYYDYADAKIHPAYYHPATGNKLIKITSKTYNLGSDVNGNVYIGTNDAGLLICEKGQVVCRQVVYSDKFRNYNVHNISIDKQGRVWLFISGTGLCQYNILSDKIILISDKLEGVSCITPDFHHAFVWMGTEQGLYKYDIVHDKLINVNPKDNKLTSKNIMQVYIDKSEKVWVATDGGSINIIDPRTGKVSYLLAGEAKGSLSSGSVYYIYEDRDSRKWIATLKGGINIIDNKNQPFTAITHDPANKNSLVSNYARSFCEDADANIWVGTAGGGLSYWNTKLNIFTNYRHNENSPASLSSDLVMSIINDYKNKVWIACFNGGINLFNKSTQTFKHYSCFNTVTRMEDRNVWKLFEDRHHNLWAATTRGGALYLYNAATDKFALFDSRLASINCFCEDKKGNLWAGNNSQLIKIDTSGKRHRLYPVNSTIFTIHEDKKGRFWLGTDVGGLLLFNQTKQTFTRYTSADGLPGNTVLNILEDNRGSIWFSTYNGLCKFNPDSKTIKNYYASDGLLCNQFIYNAALKLRSGQFLFGGVKGFNQFNPDSLKRSVSNPEIFLTGLRVNNLSVEQDSAYQDKGSVMNISEITVPYDKAVISVDFIALEYSFQDKISYAYYLEGWDRVWNNAGKIRTANYTHLNEGTYTLRIKSTNTDGVWINNQRTIRITILPPWQRTWWAYLIYAAIIGTIIYRFWLYAMRQTKLKYEVQIANLKIEREKELNEKKLSFFTNVSHEFRTPLTLIINPIKDLLNKDKNNSELTTIYRNARRLLGLVDHLLLFRKTESENDQLKIVNLNFYALIKDVYLCFKHQAKIKNIYYQFDCDDEHLMIAGDREKLEIALFNLISNAIKFTPEGGKINIRLFEKEASIIIEVCDNGCGIAGDAGEKLFDKFYQIKDNSSLKTGFGIGLYLVKSFIKLHNGEIKYFRNELGGTTFTASLPKISQFTANDEAEQRTSDRHLLEQLINNESQEEGSGEEDISNLELLISDRQSLLIIDDNVQLRTYIKKIFKEKYKTYEAADGASGLEMIKKHVPDIVISDIVMDSLSGIDLCRIIKQDASLSHIPVVLLTGDPNPEAKLMGIEVGAVDFVSKPFEKDLLIARVQAILKDRLQLQNYFYNEVTLKSNTRNISEHHKDFLYKCIAIIENYLADPDFDVKTIADEMGMSYSSLFKKIKSVTGKSVNGFIRFVRLRKAAELMIHTNCNVNEAALNAGFNDMRYFREHFIKQFGVKPSDFIKKHRAAFRKTFLMEEPDR
jgi:signal transduction histidine kinase/ligand-binding sensor domain-containing protein/CheY-like chemotaxis protein